MTIRAYGLAGFWAGHNRKFIEASAERDALLKVS